MGATIGTGDEDFFKHRTPEVRNSHVKRINEFMISLPFSLSEKNLPFQETTVQGREWALPADQGNGNRNSQIYVPHNDGPKEGSVTCRVGFVNASKTKSL